MCGLLAVMRQAKLHPHETWLYVVAGLGDNLTSVRKFHRKAAAQWEYHGIQPYHHIVGWHEDADFLNKLDQVDDYVTGLLKRNKRVSLLGTSSAGSMVLNAFMEHPEEIDKVITVAARLNARPYKRYLNLTEIAWASPMFIDSIGWLEEHQQEFLTPTMRERVMNISVLGDERIPVAASRIDGAFNTTLLQPAENHVQAVRRTMTADSGVIVDFLNLDRGQ